uniref:Uncharacterized protein n=1 Tax=Physcomitrium patens TaxID=3218 RepID=A0A2K1K7E1_PHYPA|nr:hypothetical protein PHYPA_011597 [Physcomitrium patens]
MCNGLNSGVPLDLGAHGAYNYSWPKCFCSILCWGCAEADWEIEITDRGARSLLHWQGRIVIYASALYKPCLGVFESI